MRHTATLWLLLVSCLFMQAQEVTHEMNSLALDLLDAVGKGQQQRAEQLADRYLSQCTDDKYRYGVYYAEAKHVKAHSAAARGDYRQAVEIMGEVIEARTDKRTSRNDDRIALSYFDRSTYHFRLQDTDQAIADLQTAAESYQKAKENTKYATTLCQMAVYYKYRGQQGDAEKEAECYEKAFPNVEKGTAEYLSVAAWMIGAYNEQGKFDKTSKLAKQLQKAAKKVAEKNPLRYADFLLSASVADANTGNYAEGLSYAEEARGIYEKEGKTSEHNYAVLLKNAADCQFHLQHFQEALTLYEKARPLLMQTEGEGGKVYQGCLLQLGATERIVGKVGEAQDFLQELERQIVNTTDTTTRNYANSLFELAKGKAETGNYEEATVWGRRALRCYETRGDSLQQALTLYTLSGYYTHLGLQQKADSLNALSLEISKRRGFAAAEADAFNQQAMSHYNRKEYEKADEVFGEALSLLAKSGMSSSTIYASILCNRALCQSALNRPGDAVALTREALGVQVGILGAEHGDNVMLLFNMAMYYHRLGKMDSVAHYYHRAIELQTQQVRNNFSFQSTRQRELFWQGKSYLYQIAPLFATSPKDAPPSLLTDIYDAQLFTKGILLNSEIDFRRLLQQSASKDVLSQYDELQALRAELNQCYESKNGEGQSRIPGLQHRIGQLEYAIVRQCKAYGDFTQNLSITSDSVRRAMKPGEAAVEFLEADITYGGQPDRLYLALILRPEWDAPHACRLFFRSEMEKLGYPTNVSVSELLSQPEWQNKIYGDSKLGKLVWSELLAETKGVSHIYFAPTGVFYQWGIEYMPISDNGTRVADTLSVARLSSTKLLAQRNTSTELLQDGEVVLFGGLEYENMTIDEMYAYHEETDDEVDDEEDYTLMLAEEMQQTDSMLVLAMAERGASVKNLHGAKKEVEDIERLLYDAGKEFKSYKGFSGTEESFKRLGGRNIAMLHIATHGFSFSTSNANHDWLASGQSKSAPDPLNYSGLLFSGCNNKMQHPQDFPDDIDDGILTAHEIAGLNLQDLQLTVLSACQTGTGTVQDDGVFGVQRGFKKAGAHTLVMSLWSVNDAATQLMMTTFYEGLIGGLPRREAFLKAQQTVRQSHPEPHYWAPFIMLDDI